MTPQTDPWTLGVIIALACVTVLSRSFFLMLNRPLPLPPWVERALRYAPVAALAGVVAPEVLVAGGHFIETWRDARLFAAPAGVLVFYWRRSVLWTTLVGMAVYLPLHLGLGW